MKRPAFQFYPADWRNNAKLRRCSWAARGAWIEVIGLLHDSDEYGVLSWPLKEIAQAIGCPLPLLKELAEKEVLKGCDAGTSEPLLYAPRTGRRIGAEVMLIDSRRGPVWYSSRMVRDEYVRNARGKETQFDSPKGGNGEGFGEAPKPPPKAAPTRRQGDGSTSSSSSSVGKEAENSTAPTRQQRREERAATISALTARNGADERHERDITPAVQRLA